MKKSLVLAMAMALGVTASAYAANPFSDVPAGSWAYDSVAKLAAAGVVDGYPDGTFRGNRLMTRYEMAQIVAKAMARGANVDRLAAEFADELDALGVRVSTLEAKQDNVKITGQVRASYVDNDYADDAEHDYAGKLRTRLTFKGDINDDWNYTGLIENNQNFTGNNVGDEDTKFQRAYLDGRIGGLKVRMGRANNTVAEGNIYDTRMDMVKASYGDDIKVEGYYAKPTNIKKIEGEKFDKAWGAKVSGDIEKLALSAGYDAFTDAKDVATDADGVMDDVAVWNVAAHYNFGDVKLGAMYLDSDFDAPEGYDTDGFVVSANYKGAKAAKVGSWGLAAKYYDQGVGTFINHTMNGDAGNFLYEGFKGYMAGVSYTVAKNVVGAVEYYDLEGKKDSDNTAKTLWSQVVFTF